MCISLLLSLLVGGASAAVTTEAEVFARVLARMDGDHDGRLSAAEYEVFDPGGAFGRMDADADGSVTPAELGAWFKLTTPRPDTPRPPPGTPVAAVGIDPAMGVSPWSPDGGGPQGPAPGGPSGPQGPPPGPQGPPPGPSNARGAAPARGASVTPAATRRWVAPTIAGVVVAMVVSGAFVARRRSR